MLPTPTAHLTKEIKRKSPRLGTLARTGHPDSVYPTSVIAVGTRRSLTYMGVCDPLLVRTLKEGLPWPTPKTAPERPNEGNVRMLRKKVLAGELSLEEAKSMLNGKDPREAQGKLPAAFDTWPTPVASPNENRDTKRRPSQAAGKRGKTLAAEANESIRPGGGVGHLNPTWVEWLMGFPLGWTVLAPSETP